MSDAASNPKAYPDPHSNAEKPVEDWVTGDEPMTGAQASYLKTLSDEAGEPFPEALTKAEASKRSTSCRRRPAAACRRRERAVADGRAQATSGRPGCLFTYCPRPGRPFHWPWSTSTSPRERTTAGAPVIVRPSYGL
jgi:DUF3072 family protein